jgi:hypothetical protein
LSAVTKAEVLHIDAEMQMKQQIENAIVMSAFTGIQQVWFCIVVACVFIAFYFHLYK